MTGGGGGSGVQSRGAIDGNPGGVIPKRVSTNLFIYYKYGIRNTAEV